MKKWLKNQDIFGVPVKLNFKGQEEHQTLFGGILSLVLKILMFTLIFERSIMLINRKNKDISKFLMPIQADDVELQTLEDMQITHVWEIYKGYGPRRKVG